MMAWFLLSSFGIEVTPGCQKSRDATKSWARNTEEVLYAIGCCVTVRGSDNLR